MALEQGTTSPTGTGIYGQRYAEQRAPQFVGGDIDTVTGNVIPSSKSQADQAPPPPATPTTQLGSIEPPPPPPPPSSSGPSTGATLGALATSVGTQALGKTLGETLSKGVNSLIGGAPGAAGSSPFPASTTIGEGVNNTGAGNSSPGSGLDIFGGTGSTPSSSTAGSGSSSTPNYSYDPLSLSSSYYNDPSASSLSGFTASAPSAPAISAPSAPSAPSFTPGETTVSSGFGGGEGGGLNASVSTVICTELHRRGMLDGVTFAADQAFGAWVQHNRPDVYAGYVAWAVPCVALMQRSDRFTGFVRLFAKPWAEHLAYQVGERHRDNRLGAVVHGAGWKACAVIGAVRALFRRARFA